LALNTQLISQLKAQETQFNTWAQAIYHQRDYMERQASIVKGCDVLIPMCTAAMTQEGREYIAKGYGGLDDMTVWVIGFVKIVVLLGLGLGLLMFIAHQIDKVVSHQKRLQAQLNERREQLDIDEKALEHQRGQIKSARSGLAAELSNVQNDIRTGKDELQYIQSEYERYQSALTAMRQKHTELKTQIELMEAVTRGLR
jgi:uncharacterized membrane-anchored protein YhcB (DUF1043 family)